MYNRYMAYKSKSKKEVKDNWLTQEAINLVDNERSTWENSVIYITDKVAFRIRDLVRVCTKNYWGVFDDPIDPVTGRDKIWYPLSEEVANAWTDNADLDLADINFITKPGGSYAVTQLTRQLVKTELQETYFGQDLDDSAFQKSITGTAIWKFIKRKIKGKNRVKRKLVHRLNFYIDPTAESIQAAYRVTERSLMFADEIKGMDGWKNTSGVRAEEGLPVFDAEMLKSGHGGNSKHVDVWETWGKIPEYLITGDRKDTEEVDGHIVVSGLEAGSPKCHLIEKNDTTDKEGNIIKPYEEDWAMKVPGRWDGRGPVEQVMMLQLWINIIINIRINRSYVSQLGLFKIKRGANITPQSIQKLGSNGAVLVQSMDDIEQLVMQEASQASYTDEGVIRDIAKRITRTFETITGERMPASTTATNASLQASSSKNAFTKIKERSGFFVERAMNRHLVKAIVDNASSGDIIRILNKDENIDEILDRIGYYYVNQYQEGIKEAGLFLAPEQLQIALAEVKEQLRSRPEIFIENLTKILADQTDCMVYASNEALDVGSTVDKLVMGANLLPEDLRMPVVRQIFDTMGLPYPPEMSYKARESRQELPPQGQMTEKPARDFSNQASLGV